MSGASPKPRTGPWLAVTLVALAAFVVITTEFLPIGLLAMIAAELRVTAGTAGLLVALPGAVAALTAPIITVLAARVDRRHLLVGLLGAVVLSNACVACAPSFALVILSRLLFGVGVGGFWTFAVAVGRRSVPEASGSRATALIVSGVSIGAVAGLPVGTVLGSMAGWRFAFGSASLLAALVAAALFFALPDLPSSETVRFKQLIRLFTLPVLATGYVASALTAAGHFAAYTYLQPLLFQAAHLKYAGFSWTLAAFGGAGAIGSFVAERAAINELRRTFIHVCLLLGSVIILAGALGSHIAAVIAAVVIWGAAFGAVPVCTQLWTYRAVPAQFESASALGMTVFQSAVAVGSFGGGFLVDHAGIQSAFLFGGCLSIACAFFLLLRTHDH